MRLGINALLSGGVCQVVLGGVKDSAKATSTIRREKVSDSFITLLRGFPKIAMCPLDQLLKSPVEKSRQLRQIESAYGVMVQGIGS